MRIPLTQALVGANVLLVALLGALWIDGQGGLRGVHWQPPAALRPDFGSVAAPPGSMSDGDVSRYMLLLDRPIFSPTRRPPPPPKAASAAPDPLESVQLFGTFRTEEGAGALVRVEGRSRRLRVNDPLGEWTLKEVRPREAVFARGGDTRVVPLVVAKSAATAAAAGPLPPAVAAPMGLAPPPTPVPAAAAVPSTPAAAAPGASAPAAGSRINPAAAASAARENPFVIGGRR